MAGMTVLPESGSFGVARVAPPVFRYGDHNGQVRYPSYGQLHGRPGRGGHVVKGVPTPFLQGLKPHEKLVSAETSLLQQIVLNNSA